jgi:hypothetical protein
LLTAFLTLHKLRVAPKALVFIGFFQGLIMAASRLRESVISAFGACATVVAVANTAHASTPPLAWAGAKRLHILCNVAGGPGIDQAKLSAELCGEVKRLAAKGAPVPVDIIKLGDPAVLGADAATLLVHASITRSGDSRLLAFTIRPYRTSDAQTAVLFGAAPRVVALQRTGIGGTAVRAAIDAALAQTIPWRRPPGIQPLN